jgi:hypothetical protein
MESTAVEQNAVPGSADLAQCFLRLTKLLTLPLNSRSRYEVTLCRQAGRTIFALEALHRRKPWERQSRFRSTVDRN